MKPRHRATAAGVLPLLCAAFLVKAAVLWQLDGHPLLQPHGELDTAYYVSLARQVAEGGPLAVREPFAVSPLYVFFLAAVFVLGGTLTTAKVVQIALGTLAVGLMAATARTWFGPRAAWLAGALAILTGFFTFSEVVILQSALDPFLTAAALWLVTRGGNLGVRSLLLAFSCGVALGLLTLNRPNALVYAIAAGPLVAVAGWQRLGPLRPRRLPVTLSRALLVWAGLALVIAFSAARNYAASGEAVAIASHGGLNFYMGNHAGAGGVYEPLPGITPSIAGQAADAARVAGTARGRALSAGEVSSYFYEEAVGWMAAHPGDALALAGRKALILLNRTDVPLNYSYAFYRAEEGAILGWLPVGPWLLLPVGLLGLAWPAVRSQAPGYWAWGAFVPIYAVSVAAFFVADRYRLPLLVPLCATSAGVLLWLADRLRERAWRALVAPVVALGLLTVLANLPLGLDAGRGGEQTRKAVWLVEQGDYEGALRYLDLVAPQHSHPGVLNFRVGEALVAAGRPVEAIPRLQAALEIDGDRPAIHLALGEALGAANKPADALPHLSRAFEAGFLPDVSGPRLAWALAQQGRGADALSVLARVPATAPAAVSADTALDVGSLALELQAPVEAERWLRAAVAGQPPSAQAHELLGVALILLDRSADAIAPLERACQLDAGSASAHLNLAVALAQLGRNDDARARVRESLRLDPRESRAVALLRALGGAN